MGLSFDEVKKIKEDYQKNYFKYPPMNSCGISNLRIQIDVKKKNIDLKPGEALDDLCISVGFVREPPKDMNFPTEYQGVRVFYEVIGEIRPL